MNISEVEKAVPGLVGSIGAMRWIKGRLPQKISMVLLGTAASYYSTPFFVNQYGLDPSLAGFLVGLFGMSIVDWIFASWDSLGLAEIIRDFIRAKLGLPKE